MFVRYVNPNDGCTATLEYESVEGVSAPLELEFVVDGGVQVFLFEEEHE